MCFMDVIRREEGCKQNWRGLVVTYKKEIQTFTCPDKGETTIKEEGDRSNHPKEEKKREFLEAERRKKAAISYPTTIAANLSRTH